MTLCRIVGHAIAPVAHASLGGWQLALCQRLDAAGRPDGTPPVVAIDPLHAGLHQIVIMTTDGKAAIVHPEAIFERALSGALDSLTANPAP